MLAWSQDPPRSRVERRPTQLSNVTQKIRRWVEVKFIEYVWWGYNTKGGSNGHFNHVDPWSSFLLSDAWHGMGVGWMYERIIVPFDDGIIHGSCPQILWVVMMHTWGHMRRHEETWGHMGTWGDMRKHGDTWVHMRRHEETWGHMGTHEETWGHMGIHEVL
jgi:hypothetical protein